MQENFIKILSAGVFVAIVTGIFSLIVSIINNRKIIQLERYKQKFVFVQDNYNELRKVLDQILHLDSILKDFPNNQNDITGKSIEKLNFFANERFKFLQNKFTEISYMLSQKNEIIIKNEIEEIEKIEKILLSFIDNNSELKPDPENTIARLIRDRIVKVYNLNKTFIVIVKKQLEEIQKLQL